MKVTVDLECTPEEARRFMGLPDLSSLHEAYMERLRRAVDQGVAPEAMQTLIGAWAPMGEAGMLFWKQMLERAGTTVAPK
jgi:hypothetical protein